MYIIWGRGGIVASLIGLCIAMVMVVVQIMAFVLIGTIIVLVLLGKVIYSLCSAVHYAVKNDRERQNITRTGGPGVVKSRVLE